MPPRASSGPGPMDYFGPPRRCPFYSPSLFPVFPAAPAPTAVPARSVSEPYETRRGSESPDLDRKSASFFSFSFCLENSSFFSFLPSLLFLLFLFHAVADLEDDNDDGDEEEDSDREPEREESNGDDMFESDLETRFWLAFEILGLHLENKKHLSTTTLQNLPFLIFKPGTGDEQRCSICLIDFEEGEKLSLIPCFHRFHTECITPWLEENPSCPICRHEVDFEQDGADE